MFTVVFSIKASRSSEFQSHHVQMETMIHRDTLVKINSPHPDQLHELVFATKQINLNILEQLVLSRSTPGNSDFQKWMTFDEVTALTSNTQGAKEISNWLHENGIGQIWMSRNKDYITASAPISRWENMLRTKFHIWEDHALQDKIERHILSEDYSIPANLVPHIEAVFYTSQAPPIISEHAIRRNKEENFESKFTVKDLEDGFQRCLKDVKQKILYYLLFCDDSSECTRLFMLLLHALSLFLS